MFTHLSVGIYRQKPNAPNTGLHLQEADINGVRKRKLPGEFLPSQKAHLHVSAQDMEPKATSNMRSILYYLLQVI